MYGNLRSKLDLQEENFPFSLTLKGKFSHNEVIFMAVALRLPVLLLDKRVFLFALRVTVCFQCAGELKQRSWCVC